MKLYKTLTFYPIIFSLRMSQNGIDIAISYNVWIHLRYFCRGEFCNATVIVVTHTCMRTMLSKLV